MEKANLKTYIEFNEERFTKKVIFNTGDTTAFVLNFLPGQQLPPHKHPGAEVYLLVVSGNGTFLIDGAQKSAEEFDVIHVSNEEELSFKNNGDKPASIYVVLSKVQKSE